jgi:hypothetical protein
MKALIYNSELVFIAQCMMDYPDIETGGDLFGFWTYSGFPVIQYVIGPGKKAKHSVAFFNQDEEYLFNMGKALQNRHGLQHIGEWHSHHRLGLARPSGHDVSTVVKAINDCALQKFFLVIGCIDRDIPSLNGFMFQQVQQRNYTSVNWVVLEGISPIRTDVDANFDDSMLYRPHTQSIRNINIPTTTLENVSYNKPVFTEDNWLEGDEGQEKLKNIYEGLQYQYGIVKMYLENNSNLLLQFKHAGNTYDIILPFDFPYSKPIIAKKGNSERKVLNEGNNYKVIHENLLQYIDQFIKK